MERTESDYAERPGEPTVGSQVDGGRENRPHGEVLQDGGGERYDDCGSLSASSQDDGSDALSELGCSISDMESQSAAMLITNIINTPSAPTYSDGEYEDGKADMIAKLMKNHSNIVSSSLVERSNLIRSVTWFSHHVPGCVVKSLIHSIACARNKAYERSRRHRKISCSGVHDMKKLPKDEIEQPPMAEYKALQFFNTVPSPMSSSSPERATSVPPTPPFMIEDSLPLTTGHDGALLFVDISGFTKISLVMDVESLSNAINSYFDMIVNEIILHGGDILKFAGDSVFAEWKVSPQESRRDLDCCVSIAAICAATIVARCSDFPVYKAHDMKMSKISQRSTRRLSTEVEPTRVDDSSNALPRRAVGKSRANSAPLSASMSMPMATLNVKCAIGAGHIVGIHVGDNDTRREYFILGDIIGQVANAERAAGMGQVFASPEAFQHLVNAGDPRSDFKEALGDGQPIRIADHDEQFFDISRRNRQNSTVPSSIDEQNMAHMYDNLNSTELQWLRKTLSLYVHPVVVNDDSERAPRGLKIGSYRERHLAEAELRTVYTCFISPLVEYTLTGNDSIDQKLFRLLNDIMILTTRELNRVQGHLRQYILDDKGLVLICTFGLRGSTFPDMVAQRALPFSLSIRSALEKNLGVKSTVGATLGKVYCGVVGGLERHEFAVLGPSVNLAARLMASDKNHGILVDKSVRILSNKIFFKPLPAVTAKGYEEPVPIFEPLKQVIPQERAKKNFCGRESELKQIMRTAKEVILHHSISRLFLITAMSGSGKTLLMDQATEHIQAMATKMHCGRVIITRNISNEGDSIIPFSFFRSIFKGVLSQVRQEDEESLTSSRRSSIASSVDGQLDTLSLNSQSSQSSKGSTEMTRFRFICHELNAPPEFMELIGKKFLGIRDGNDATTQYHSATPQIGKIVNFMADAFVRCTKHANLVLLALDDVQWMDELSWKVVQAIFERAKNVLTLCGSRPPSSNLTMDPIFFSDLQGRFQKEGRYHEVSLAPFDESEVKEMIAETLRIRLDEVDVSLSRNLLTTSGGMPHYLSFIIDAIKRNNLTVRLENGMIGMENSTGDDSKIFGSVNELLLYRIDALDSSVRTLLLLSAVLGTEFDLVDAALAFEELFGIDESKQLESASEVIQSFEVAIKEGIIEKSDDSQADGDGDLMHEQENNYESMMSVLSQSKGRRETHPLFLENCRLRFTHDSWKTSILNVMLDEAKREMHEHVAISLERDLDAEALDQDDFEKQIAVFKHWKLSGNFYKASASALTIGGQLMLLGLNAQAILLFDDAWDILTEISDDEVGGTKYGGVSASVLDSIDVPELDSMIKLNIAKGKAYLTLGQGVNGADAYQRALDVLHNTPCADDIAFDRRVSFPIFSGLFTTLKMGGTKDDTEGSYEKDLCKRFVEQARLNGDPVHYGRALAMEAETLGRLGNFEQALEVVERIKPIYNIETQHDTICKVYGSDRVAQAFSHSVNFNSALGNIQAALDTCNYIVEEVIPKSDPKNVHNSFCLLYTVFITFKENGLSLRAHEVFQKRIVAPFEEYFGQGGSTFSKPLFKPMLVMFELQAMDDIDAEKIEEYTEWALDEDNFEKKMAALESPWAGFSASPIALHSEICFDLGKRHFDTDRRNRLIQKAITLMEQSCANTHASNAYSNRYAEMKLKVMKSFARDMALQQVYTSDDIYSAMTAQEWDNLGHSESLLIATTDDRKVMNPRAVALLEHHLDRLVKNRNPDAKVSEITKHQLTSFVDDVSQSYNDAEFHSYSHALHVTTSMNSLLTLAPTENPLNAFSLVFSALLHDVGHTGMSNKILCEISHPLVAKFTKNVPIAERNSIDVCLSLFFRSEYKLLRESIAPDEKDKIKLAKTLFQAILATDIATPKNVQLAIRRFEACEEASHLPAPDLNPLRHYIFDLLDGIGLDEDAKVRHPDEFVFTHDELQICTANEHLMMLSDIAHLLQGWTNFVKWNFRLYKEIHACFKRGLCDDPKEGWYQGQMVFMDKYVIPLSKRSKRFLQSGFSEKLLRNGLTNRKIWMEQGKVATEIISKAVEADESEVDVIQRLIELGAG